jgi:hypothetical protein
MENATTFYNGKKYLHSDYQTATKQKSLPEPVKKAIQGDKYVEITNE